MARTAVIAGTATAVSGGIRNSQMRRAEAQEESADIQQGAMESQAELAQMQQQRAAVPTQSASAPAASVDLSAQLQRLADLRTAGVLDDTEFAAAKAKLLS
jgi:type II secretory pathway component HofQ